MKNLGYVIYTVAFITVAQSWVHGSQNISCGEWTEQKDPTPWREYYPGEWWAADCRIKNPDVHVNLWKKISNAEDKRIFADGMKIKEGNNMFNFTNLSFSDAGDYYCEVCNRKKEFGKLIIMKEGKAFQYPKIINKPKRSIDFRTELMLTCEISGWYKLRWFKDGVRYNVKEKPLKIGTKNMIMRSVLNIKQFSKENEGVYSCNAERKIVHWYAEDKVRLEMKAFVKPAFKNMPERVASIKEGKPFNRTILATGYPKPEVTCRYKSKNSNHDMVKKSKSSNLHIPKLKFIHHNGTSFQCTAKNELGNVTRTFSLNILVKPKINIHTYKRTRNKTIITRRKSLDLSCKVNEANPPATVRWTYSRYNNYTTWIPVTTKLRSARVVGNKLQVDGQTVYRMFYKCAANNTIGNDSYSWQVLNESAFREAENDNLQIKKTTSTNPYFVVILVIVGCVAVLSICTGVIMYRRKKLLGGYYICTLPPYQDYINILEQNRFIHEQTHKLPYMSEWEFPRRNILLQEELGSGAFGVVYFAHAVGMSSFLTRRSSLKDKKPQRRLSLTRLKKHNSLQGRNDCEVMNTAIKTLKVNYNQTDLSDILSELKVLIHVGEHENVLRILGACTKVQGNEAPLIILEYCSHGNLKEFLRTRRAIYEPEWKMIDNIRLSITDLANFATHIARGMKFLISRKCIHRDLAARNVLISDGYIAKISDFGLARDVYDNLEYTKLTPGLLPVKWMAIEAIKDRIFNEKTDVWSYGIVLWEMFTLGGTPYPDLDASLVLTTLLKGKRMNPPMYCPQEISGVMLSCWSKDPLERPSFSDIVCQLPKLCEFQNTAQEAPYQNFP